MKSSARVLITNSDFLKANRGPLYHRLNITVTFRMHLSRIIIDSLYDHLRNADDQCCRNRHFLISCLHRPFHWSPRQRHPRQCSQYRIGASFDVLLYSSKLGLQYATLLLREGCLPRTIVTWCMPTVCRIPIFEACCIVRSSLTVSKSPDFFRAERALLHFLSTVHSVHLNSQ